MDPIACLLNARSAIVADDYDASVESLRSYAAWRRNGGFEPIVPLYEGRGTIRGDRMSTILNHMFVRKFL
jgi:hypothetical protein